MFSAFHMGPTASGRRLCVIERVLFRFNYHVPKIVRASRKYIDYNFKAKLPCKDPNFMTRDLLPLNNNLSISHSLPPLADGTIQKCLLAMRNSDQMTNGETHHYILSYIRSEYIKATSNNRRTSSNR